MSNEYDQLIKFIADQFTELTNSFTEMRINLAKLEKDVNGEIKVETVRNRQTIEDLRTKIEDLNSKFEKDPVRSQFKRVFDLFKDLKFMSWFFAIVVLYIATHWTELQPILSAIGSLL